MGTRMNNKYNFKINDFNPRIIFENNLNRKPLWVNAVLKDSKVLLWDEDVVVYEKMMATMGLHNPLELDYDQFKNFERVMVKNNISHAIVIINP